MTYCVHSLTKLKLKCWTLLCQERFKFGASDSVVCKTACNYECFRGPGTIDVVDWKRHVESLGSTI